MTGNTSVNTQWNDALDKFEQHKYALPYISAGTPGKTLKKIGLPDVDIRITTITLREHIDKHNIPIELLKNIPKLINSPALVFVYQGKDIYSGSGGIDIIVNKKNSDNSNLIIGIQLRYIKKELLHINSIRTFHFKKNTALLNWINEGRLVYADLKKITALQAGEPISPDTCKAVILGKYNTEKNKKQIFVEENIEKVKTFFNLNALSGINYANTHKEKTALQAGEPISPATCKTVYGYKYNTKINTMQMLPTYKLLNDYSHLISDSLGKTELIKYGTVKDTVKAVNDIIKSSYPQVYKLALHLADKQGNTLQTSYNIWHWCRTNIKYAYDKPGHEELRTPARTYADRHKGVDCDDFTIMVSSLLLNLGITPQLNVVAFNGSPNWSHIFAGIDNRVINGKPKGGIIIDPVDTEFNRILYNITKTYIMEVNAIEKLSGIAGNTTDAMPRVLGYGMNFQPDEISTKVLNATKCINTRTPQGRKTAYILAHNQSIHSLPLQLVSEHIEDINPDGTITWKNRQVGEIAEEFLDETDGIIQGIVSGEDADFTEEERLALFGLSAFAPEIASQDLNGLGWSLKKAWGKFKKKVKKTWHKTKEKIKKVSKAVAKAGKKVWQGVKKVSFAAPRIALLGLLRINAFGLATRIYLGYMSRAEAQKLGIPSDIYLKAVKMTKTIERFWVKAGGSASAFRNTIMKGKNKKPILNKKMKILYNKGLHGIDGVAGIDGLGAASVAAMVASAGALLAKIWGWIKKIPWGKVIDAAGKVKNLIKKKKDKTSATQTSSSNHDSSEDYNPSDFKTMSVPTKPLDSESKGGTNWLIPAAAAAVIGILMFTK